MAVDHLTISSQVEMLGTAVAAVRAWGEGHVSLLVLLASLVLLLGGQGSQSKACKEAGCTKSSERHGD